MTERRYTLTESQLMEFCSRFVGSGLPISRIISTITPGPVEDGAEMEDSIAFMIRFYMGTEQDIGDTACRLRLAEAFRMFLTSEVTRQVDERTKVCRKALEDIDRGFCSHRLKIWEAQMIARQALAHKGAQL